MQNSQTPTAHYPKQQKHEANVSPSTETNYSPIKRITHYGQVDFYKVDLSVKMNVTAGENSLVNECAAKGKKR